MASQPAQRVIIASEPSPGMTIGLAVIALFIPPLAVGLQTGCSFELLLNILLTLIGWIPGVVHAWLVSLFTGCLLRRTQTRRVCLYSQCFMACLLPRPSRALSRLPQLLCCCPPRKTTVIMTRQEPVLLQGQSPASTYYQPPTAPIHEIGAEKV